MFKRTILVYLILCLRFVETKRPFDANKLSSWRLECELGLIYDSDCPVDGGWSAWTSWTACHGACDEIGHRKRSRECVNPPPSKDGSPCTGPDEDIESCYLNNCSLDDFRKLVDGDPARSAGLKQLEAVPSVIDRCLQIECPFEAIEAALAHDNTWQMNSEELWNALLCVKRNLGCPVAGQWSNWGPWSTCGARCGKGKRWRERKCDSPPPSDARLMCSGAPLQNEECEGDQCAIDEPQVAFIPSGSWSPWSQWTDCSEKCGVGIRRRKRFCVEKRTTHSLFAWRTNCRGQHDQLEVCSKKKCRLNGGWSSWGPWGACSQTCGAGKRSRSRSCTRPVPFGEGSNCFGSRTETGTCHLKPCDVYSHTIALFNGDSILEYNFEKKHSIFFHFFIRFMPLSPTGTLFQRGNSNYLFIHLMMHKWHLCLDVSVSSKCILPRICSPAAIAPAIWHTALVTFTNNAASLRVNDDKVPIKCAVTCNSEIQSNVISVSVGERFHGAIQEVILNFIPLNLFIKKEHQTKSKSYLFPASASNIIYDKGNLEEAFINIQNEYYLRVPCFRKTEESWHIKLTLKPEVSDGLILMIFDDISGNWVQLLLQNSRLKIKSNIGNRKPEAIGSAELQLNQWLDVTLSRNKAADIIEATINADERLHIILSDKDVQTKEVRYRQSNLAENSSAFDDISDAIEEKEISLSNPHIEFGIKCRDEFFVGNIPSYIKQNISEEIPPFSGTIASLHVNGVLFNLHDCGVERNKDDSIQLSSRTASVSGSYHEIGWGKSNKLNITCLYSKTRVDPANSKSYWIYLDDDISKLTINKNITPINNGRILRLSLPEDKELRGFYTCRSFYNKRTRNIITHGVVGNIENKLTGPDFTTATAVLTTISLVIFTLGWLIIEGINDLRDGYGFFRDLHLTPEKEAEAVCSYIDRNINLLGSKSAARLAKARARRRARQLASRASFAAQEPEGLLEIDKIKDDGSPIEEETPLESLPALPDTKCLLMEPSHAIFRCEPSYVSSPRHGSNITSPETKITSSSSPETSPRNLCSRLLMSRVRYSSRESLKSKTLPSKIEKAYKKSPLFTIKSSTIMNLSPGQRVLQKFHELKPDDSL